MHRTEIYNFHGTDEHTWSGVFWQHTFRVRRRKHNLTRCKQRSRKGQKKYDKFGETSGRHAQELRKQISILDYGVTLYSVEWTKVKIKPTRFSERSVQIRANSLPSQQNRGQRFDVWEKRSQTMAIWPFWLVYVIRRWLVDGLPTVERLSLADQWQALQIFYPECSCSHAIGFNRKTWPKEDWEFRRQWINNCEGAHCWPTLSVSETQTEQSKMKCLQKSCHWKPILSGKHWPEGSI